MFGIGMPEMLMILAIALIVIGPKKLPDLARSIGRALGEFRRATSDIKESIQRETGLGDVKESLDELGQEIKQSVDLNADLIDEAGKETRASKDHTANLGKVRNAFERMNADGQTTPEKGVAGDGAAAKGPPASQSDDSSRQEGDLSGNGPEGQGR